LNDPRFHRLLKEDAIRESGQDLLVNAFRVSILGGVVHRNDSFGLDRIQRHTASFFGQVFTLDQEIIPESISGTLAANVV
jgi:hypothetical protein